MSKLLLILSLASVAACGPREAPDPPAELPPAAAPRDSAPRPDSLMAGDTARAP